MTNPFQCGYSGNVLHCDWAGDTTNPECDCPNGQGMME
jgi:hypothetical protein